MTKIGEKEFCDDNDAFARVYNNLLLHEYIYYFTPVHFNLLFAYFSILIYQLSFQLYKNFSTLPPKLHEQQILYTFI